MRPVIVAAFEFFPAGFQVFLPFTVPKELPERAGGNEYAVVQVRSPGEPDYTLDLGAEPFQLIHELDRIAILLRSAFFLLPFGLLFEILDLWFEEIG
jgi:hypothetical protein